MKAVRSTHSKKLASAIGVGALFLTLAACSPTDTPAPAPAEGSALATYEEMSALSGTERHEALVAAAQEEGVVVFYSTAPGWQPVLDAFSDEYGIDVEVFNGRSETILQRVVQEFQAGLHNVDVFEDENAALLAREAGMTAAYKNAELTSQIPGFEDDGGMIPFRLSVPAFAWNTDLVSDDEVPVTIEELADPKWDGKLTLDAGAWTWYIGVHDYLAEKGWDEDKITEFFETIVSYSSPQGSSIAMTELLAAGEYSAGTSVLTQVISRNAAKGAPIAWQTADGRYTTPLIVQPEGGVLMANAPHPAAAVLLMDFILSDGAQVLLDAGTFINTAVPLPGGPLDTVDVADLHFVDTAKLMDERDKWTAAWDALVRQQ